MTKNAGLAATMTLLAIGLTAGVALATEAAPVELTEPSVIGKHQVAPVYPPAAEMARFEGSVTVAAAVDREGEVTEVAVVECDHPNLGFEAAALDAVRQWKFRPARAGDVPIEAVTYIRLHFNTPRRQGHVTGGLIAASIGMPSLGGVKGTVGAGGASLASHDGPDRMQHVRLPAVGLGELYDRTSLVPNQSVIVGNPVPYTSTISPGGAF